MIPMKIAIIVGKMDSGGKKNLIMEYYRHIDRNIVQFDFICDSDSQAIPEEEIKKLGGRVYKVAPYQNIVRNMSDMKRIFEQNQYSVVHAYNSTMNLFPMAVAKSCNVPVRISESLSMAHEGDWKTVLKKMLRPMSKWFANYYMSCGEDCGRWQFGDKLFDEGKVRVFKTVINTDVNKYDESLRNATRKEYGIEENIVIGHIGRLTEQKNTLFIIDIFNALVKKEPKAKLLVIGDGNLREAMLAKIDEYGIKNSVLYLGRREDIPQFYNAMDCFLLPSLYEGLPVVGVEAENCGLPMFFSTEIPEESSACDDLGVFMSLEKTPEEWADAILQAVKKNMPVRKGKTEEVKAAGFDSGVEANKLLEYYENLIASLN